MRDAFDSFLGFLPNLIAATVITVIGAGLLVVIPWLVWRRLQPRVAAQGPGTVKPITTALWIWTALAGLVVFRFAVGALV